MARVLSIVVAVSVALCLPLGAAALFGAFSERDWIVGIWGISTIAFAGGLLWNRKHRNVMRMRVLFAALPLFAIACVIAGVWTFVRFVGWVGWPSLAIFLMPALVFAIECVVVAMAGQRGGLVK